MTKNLPLHHLASGITRLLPRIPCVDDSFAVMIQTVINTPKEKRGNEEHEWSSRMWTLSVLLSFLPSFPFPAFHMVSEAKDTVRLRHVCVWEIKHKIAYRKIAQVLYIKQVQRRGMRGACNLRGDRNENTSEQSNSESHDDVHIHACILAYMHMHDTQRENEWLTSKTG